MGNDLKLKWKETARGRRNNIFALRKCFPEESVLVFVFLKSLFGIAIHFFLCLVALHTRLSCLFLDFPVPKANKME